MALAEFVKYGTPALLFVLIILNVYQSTVIHQLVKELDDMKKRITWSDMCSTKHIDVDRRLDRIEAKVFNGAHI